MFIKSNFSLSVSLPLSLSSYLSLQSCQADLVKDNGHKYFLSVLADSYMPVSKHQSPLCICGKGYQCQIIFTYNINEWIWFYWSKRSSTETLQTAVYENRYISLKFPSLSQAEHRTMAVFILAVIVNSYNTGQVWVCLYVSVCVWACLDILWSIFFYFELFGIDRFNTIQAQYCCLII